VIIALLYYHHARMAHIVVPKREDAASKTADISQDEPALSLFSDPLRPRLQDFCGADEIGG